MSEDAADDDPVAALAPRDVTGEPQDAVQLMTMHAAKGLEFPCVFVLRVVSAIVPRPATRKRWSSFRRSFAARTRLPRATPKTLHQEEERRLFYVALTRAMDELYICGQFARGKKDLTPPGYMRELLEKKNTSLRGAIECIELSQATLIEKIHAAAEPMPSDLAMGATAAPRRCAA